MDEDEALAEAVAIDQILLRAFMAATVEKLSATAIDPKAEAKSICVKTQDFVSRHQVEGADAAALESCREKARMAVDQIYATVRKKIEG